MYGNSFELIDFHTHILPGIDDGSEDVEMSVKMLEALKQQGTDVVVASPHFYKVDKSIEEFCSERNMAYSALNDYIAGKGLDLPVVIPAAEIKLYPGLWQEPELDKLCVTGSKVLLIEMPYENWSAWMYNEVYSVCAKGYIPLMVHVERYLKSYVGQDDILNSLLSMRVFAQCNAEGFEESRKRKLIKKIIGCGKLAAIGTDAHNLTDRKPNFDFACKYIEKKFGLPVLKKIMKTSSMLLGSEAFELL